MKLNAVIPASGVMDVEEFARRHRGLHGERTPFAADLLEFFGRFSRAIFQSREASRYPELTALAYWMRPAELERLRAEFHAAVPADTVVMPRGTVFHIPPGNVDTIFVYSLVLAALMGNTNIIRLSDRPSPQTDILVDLLGRQIDAGGSFEGLVSVVRYGHDAQINAALTELCDCRVIWGGDNTVRTIRATPLPPHAVELVFPDRYSLAAIDAGAYLALAEADRPAIAADFFNDAFWFDQMACSSPRLVVWCGGENDVAAASSLFWLGLEGELERRAYMAQPAVSVRRLGFSCEVAADQALSAHVHGRYFTRLVVPSLDGFSREHCGGGLFFEAAVESLEHLVPFITRRDQTISYFGFARRQLENLAGMLMARGVERIVPIGQALKFGRFWDGHDMLMSFGRYIHIITPRARKR